MVLVHAKNKQAPSCDQKQLSVQFQLSIGKTLITRVLAGKKWINPFLTKVTLEFLFSEICA